MGKELTLKQRKDLARSLFMNDDITQAELAERVGISKVTINKWVNEGKWIEQKEMLTATSEGQLRNFITQLAALNKVINAREGLNYPTTGEVDTQVKLTKAIEMFKGDMSLVDLISYSKRLLKFLRTNHPDKVKEVALLINAFLQEQA